MSNRFIALVSLLLLLPATGADNWPHWRGPRNNGLSGETNLPSEWSDTKHLLWAMPLPGMSGSTPVVWNDRIFLLSEDGDDVVLICAGTDGRQLWKRKFAGGKHRFRGDEGTQASPSPNTDGKHVWVFAGTGDLACFDFEGNEVWKFNVQDRYGKFEIWHGMHVTPLLHGDRLYHSLLHSGGWSIIALDKNTGNEIWKVNRQTDAVQECEQSYASPCIWSNGKEEYLVIHGCDYATAHRLSDGNEIWRVGGLNPKGSKYNNFLRFVASPVTSPDLIVVPSAKNGPVVGVRPDAKGSFAGGSEFERWRRPNNTPDVPSPLIHDGLVYLCRETGVLICMDTETGRQHYEHALHRARYRASPVYADGKIYCTARDGTTSVVKPGRHFELIATNKLPDEIAASPAISNGRIYLRGFKALYAIGNREEGP